MSAARFRIPGPGEVIVMIGFLVGLLTIASVIGGLLVEVISGLLGMTLIELARLFAALWIGVMIGLFAAAHLMEGES